MIGFGSVRQRVQREEARAGPHTSSHKLGAMFQRGWCVSGTLTAPKRQQDRPHLDDDESARLVAAVGSTLLAAAGAAEGAATKIPTGSR